MKRTTFILLSWGIFTLIPAFAQQPPRHQQPKADKHQSAQCNISVADAAKSRTEQMATVLQLSDLQKHKVYNMLLEQGKKDSITAGEIDRLRTEQQKQHTAQNEALKKLLTDKQLAAMSALPAMQHNCGGDSNCDISQCCARDKMVNDKDYKAMKDKHQKAPGNTSKGDKSSKKKSK